ncbi:MAG: hypothetical protein ACQKBU_10980 [Verrucomicrobiales bacterium]
MNGRGGVESELDLGVGWQDPAVIRESGLCVWRSGETPVLDFKQSGDFLRGRMAILWSGAPHDTPGVVDRGRDYDRIAQAARQARQAVMNSDLEGLAQAVALSYQVQQGEGMNELPEVAGALARKYSGGGHGGYGLYLFSDEGSRDRAVSEDDRFRAIEPYIR